MVGVNVSRELFSTISFVHEVVRQSLQIAKMGAENDNLSWVQTVDEGSHTSTKRSSDG